jgi:hypothetical protein
MFQRRLVRRSFQMGAWATALVLCATAGSTEPDKSSADPGTKDRKACKVARKTAKELEQSNHLRQARETLLSCAKVSCSAMVRQECLNRYTLLASDIPSIVPLVTDQSGAPRVDVAVRMDGELLTSRLDGRALAVDPGLHEFTFSTDGGVVITQRLMIVQGQRNQPITVAMNAKDKRAQKRTLAPSVAMAPSEGAKMAVEKPPVEKQGLEEPSDRSSAERPDRATVERDAEKSPESSDDVASSPSVHHKGPGPLPWVLSAAGLAGIGTYGLLTVWGRKDNDALANCSPDCSAASLDRVKTLYLAADISLGVGIAALGAGVTWLALSSGSNKEKPPAQAAYVFDVQPTPSGAFATVRGAF